MILIGLTGVIGAGKSLVGSLFKDLGVHIIEADDLAKEAVKVDTRAYKKIIKEFGTDVTLPITKRLDRKKIAKIIFSNEEKRKQLENIVHPEVQKLLNKKIELQTSLQKTSDFTFILYLVPLLFEKIKDRSKFKYTICVYADKEVCIKRVMKRDSISRKEVLDRLATQIPGEQKKKLSDFVIDNSSTVDNLKEQVESVLTKITQLEKTC